MVLFIGHPNHTVSRPQAALCWSRPVRCR